MSAESIVWELGLSQEKVGPFVPLNTQSISVEASDTMYCVCSSVRTENEVGKVS